MTDSSNHTVEEGYGVLKPYEKVFETDNKFKSAVDKAYDAYTSENRPQNFLL